MIGRSFWIVIWYVILLLGAMGLWSGIHWGRRSQWTNLDEIFRAVGTMLVSIGMLFLLYGGVEGWGDEAVLIAALIVFVAAFVVGRRRKAERPRSDHDDLDWL